MAATVPKILSAALLALSAATACTGPFVPPPPPQSSQNPVTSQQSSAQECTAPPPAGEASPARIVGEWICTGSTTQTRYRFSADGRYESREALEYNVPTGRFVFHRDQTGRYTTAEDRLELAPERSTRTRKSPEDPGGDYVDVPEPLDARVFTFRADLDSLRLQENGRRELLLLRVS
ncbi:hypothetical protein [Lentzea sp. NPDC003310]|uniref:hypothetical protein n=1 Tax=Lentzea sp. NPDC003310 TaxID=3154447 RepID=UPI0033A1D8DB